MRKSITMFAVSLIAFAAAGCSVEDFMTKHAFYQGQEFTVHRGMIAACYMVDSPCPPNFTVRPGVQAVYTDPGDVQVLKSGNYVFIEEPTYRARLAQRPQQEYARQSSSSSNDELIQTMGSMGQPFGDYGKSMVDSTREMNRSVNQMGRSQGQTMGILNGACQQQQQNQQRRR